MKKIYAALFVGLIALSGIGVYLNYTPTKTYKKPPKRTRLDEAIKWRNEITKDPALGYVPHTRMLDVYRRIETLNAMGASRAGELVNAKWRERGPYNVGGRTRTIMIDRNDPSGNTVFSAGVTGGLWKTTNITAGQPTWQPIGHFYENINVNSMAQDPNNLNTMYFGTGEPHGGAGRGLGIWKSTDAGTSWTQLPSTSNAVFYYVVRLFVHPVTGDVYAATEAGLQRSKDGGTTWEKVLGSGVVGGISNAITDIEYAADGAMYVSDGHNGGACSVYRSDAGTEQGNIGKWFRVTASGSGFPSSQTRIELSVAPSNANIIYALTAQGGDASGIYKSSNRGQNWAKVSNAPDALGMTNFTRGQAWYDLTIGVDPTDENTVIIGGIDLLKSTTGGTTWTQISQWFGGGGFQYVHADQHEILWDKEHPGRVFFGNDGGIYMSNNKGTNTISKNYGYNVTQFYAHAMHPDKFSNYFLAGAQDNGSQQFDQFDIDNTVEVLGGDGFMCHIDQDEPDTQFVSLYYGEFHVSVDGGQNFGDLLTNAIGSGFYTPSDYDNTANILYTQAASNGSYFRWKFSDGLGNGNEGETVNVTNFNGSVSHVYASDNIPNRIYIGSTAGRIYVVDNADVGTTNPSTQWVLPTGGNISCVLEAPGDANHIIVTMSNYGINSVWETNNGGTNWHSIEGDLPDMPVNWIAFHPYDNDQVLLATDAGVWVTENIDGSNTNWDISVNMPVVRTDMLQIRASDGLISAGTHGRGIFSTDFLSPVLPNFRVDRVAYLNSSPTFQDLSINSQSWLWNFGDGTTSTLQAPSHSYSAVNTYNVDLTINDTVTVSDFIKVLPDRPVPYTSDVSVYGGSFEAHDEDFGVDKLSGTGFEKGKSTKFGKDGTHSGDFAYVTGLNDDYYEHNTESYLYTPNFDLSEPAIYEFKFWSKFSIQQGFDGFRVEYSTDRGQTWAQLGSENQAIDEDLNKWFNYTSTSNQTAFPQGSAYFTGYQATWKEFKTDLNALTGQSDVAFRFVFKSNGSNRLQGVAIDDVQVTKYTDILETVLRSFTGQFTTPNAEDVTLEWITQPEYLCKGFTYFISENGKDFTENTALIGGQGSTADATSYATVVNNRTKDLYYFQLKVIGLDNSFFLSDIIAVSRGGENVDLSAKIFPNPFKDNIGISFNQVLDEVTTFSLYDSAGRLVLSEAKNPNGVFTNLETSKLQGGVYILVIEYGDQRIVEKVMKVD